MKIIKIGSIVSFMIALAALIIGAGFHGYRIHPENISHYNIGVAMGISMASIFVLFLIIGIVLLIVYRKKKRLLP